MALMILEGIGEDSSPILKPSEYPLWRQSILPLSPFPIANSGFSIDMAQILARPKVL